MEVAVGKEIPAIYGARSLMRLKPRFTVGILQGGPPERDAEDRYE